MSQKVVAAQRIRDLEKQYGKTFLEKSLHGVRFEYETLKRIASGLEPRPHEGQPK